MATGYRPVGYSSLSYLLQWSDFKTHAHHLIKNKEDSKTNSKCEHSDNSQDLKTEKDKLRKINCENLNLGCKIRLTEEKMLQHSSICPYKITACPLHYISHVKCPWMGCLSKVIKHLKAFHNEHVEYVSIFLCKSMMNTYKLVIFNGEVFLYYKMVKYGVLYALVRRIGLTSQTYRCVFSLKHHDRCKRESITISTPVLVLDKQLDEIFDSGTCLIIEKQVLHYYMELSEINFWTTIEVHEKD
ncbi:hypothetical protein L9F63_016428 [Diploptera punctata]|uniref:SIAH-type domain-containing protein n=1 Tax=Diploptera punctata TaxID=6984 RepID=A0AAD8A1A2_DIPPU|nr:hypothetical protein L9F63_016428 [Diploptera punctata]